MKKSVGIVRGIDSLGRITLDKKDRAILGLDEFAKVEMVRVGKKIILQRFEGLCEICGNKITKENKIEIEGKAICRHCATKIVKNTNIKIER